MAKSFFWFFIFVLCSALVQNASNLGQAFGAEATVTGTTTIIGQQTFTAVDGGVFVFQTAGATVTITVPEDSYSEDLQLQVVSTPSSSVVNSNPAPTQLNFVGRVFYIDFFTLSGTNVSLLSKSVQIVITYNSADIVGIQESTLTPYRWGGAGWLTISPFNLNTASKEITFSTNQFSIFGIFGEPNLVTELSSGPTGGYTPYSLPAIFTHVTKTNEPLTILPGQTGSLFKGLPGAPIVVEVPLNTLGKTVHVDIVARPASFAEKEVISSHNKILGNLVYELLITDNKGNKLNYTSAPLTIVLPIGDRGGSIGRLSVVFMDQGDRAWEIDSAPFASNGKVIFKTNFSGVFAVLESALVTTYIQPVAIVSPPATSSTGVSFVQLEQYATASPGIEDGSFWEPVIKLLKKLATFLVKIFNAVIQIVS